MDVQQGHAMAEKAALEGRLTKSLSEVQALRSKQDQMNMDLQTEVKVHPELQTNCLTCLSEAPALLFLVSDRLVVGYAGLLSLKEGHKLQICICRRSAA